jgi:hypothetical protein
LHHLPRPGPARVHRRVGLGHVVADAGVVAGVGGQAAVAEVEQGAEAGPGRDLHHGAALVARHPVLDQLALDQHLAADRGVEDQREAQAGRDVSHLDRHRDVGGLGAALEVQADLVGGHGDAGALDGHRDDALAGATAGERHAGEEDPARGTHWKLTL